MPADCNRQGSDWCIVALVGSNELFIQPRNPATASNNLQLTTNLRRYSFEFLNARGVQTTPWFRVTFRYLPERAPEARSAGTQQCSGACTMETPGSGSQPAPGAAFGNSPGALYERQAGTVSVTLLKALESHVPADYIVLPDAKMDLDRSISFDRAHDWSIALPAALDDIDIDMSLDPKQKIIRLTPKQSPFLLSDK